MAVALVTGGARRVGRALSLRLAQVGYDVVVHYSSSKAAAEETCEDIAALGRNAWSLHADFRKEDAPELVAEFVSKQVGALDALINNASLFPEPEKRKASGSFEKESLEAWNEQFAVNARAPFFLIQQLAPLLSASQNGCVLNILDQCLDTPFLSRPAYTASQWALRGVTEVARTTYRNCFRVESLVPQDVLLPGAANSPALERFTARVLQLVRPSSGR